LERLVTTARDNWQTELETQGFTWHHVRDEIYWTEGTYYKFQLPEVLAIETATARLQEMCLKAVQHIIDEKLYADLLIPEWIIPAIEKSW
jgi:glutathionylspermidine synthase